MAQNGPNMGRRMSEISATESEESSEYKPIITGVTCEGQPRVNYDLLTKDEKSPSFHVRFETANPQPRFIVQYRMMCRHFGELREADKEEFIRVSLTFADHHELFDASLTLPGAKYNRNDLSQEIFFAYLECPYVENYLKVYRVFKTEIPRWPHEDWVCQHWQKRTLKETVDTMYIRAVKRGQSKLTVQSNLLLRRYQRPVCDNRRLRDFRRPSTLPQDFNFTALTPPEWILVAHSTQPLVGVACQHDKDTPWSVTERLGALNRLQALCEKYSRHRGCFMCLSLVGPYRFGNGIYHNVIGFLAFPAGIPDRLNAKCAHPMSRRASQMIQDESMLEKMRNLDQLDFTPATDNVTPALSVTDNPNFFENCCSCFLPKTDDD